MKVYQLKIKDLDLLMDPVFKTREGAKLFLSKYRHRNIEITEKEMNDECDFVYRIREVDDEGYILADELYSSIEAATMEIKNEKQSVVKEYLISEESFNYELVEV